MNIDLAFQKYEHYKGHHDHEWDRFLIRSYSFHDAAELAALLGWWLHCWQWKQCESKSIITVEEIN